MGGVSREKTTDNIECTDNDEGSEKELNIIPPSKRKTRRHLLKWNRIGEKAKRQQTLEKLCKEGNPSLLVVQM